MATAVGVTMTPAAGVTVIPPSSALSARQAQQFQQMRVDNELIDFVIHTNGREFRCHRVILAASSEYFKAMLRSEMKEAASNQTNLDVIPAAILELLIDHMYQNEVIIQNELLGETIEASNYLYLQEMKEMCATKAKDVIDPSNVVLWRPLAEKFNLAILKVKCAEIINTSLPEVSQTPEFLQLPIGEVRSYLDAEKITIDPDDHLEASLNWIQHNPEERIVNIDGLIEKIELLKCSVECLQAETENRADIFKKSPDAQAKIIKTCLQLLTQGGARKKRKKKGSKASMNVIIGGVDGNVLNRSGWVLTEAMRREKLCEIPDGHDQFCGVCMVPVGFVVTGGYGPTYTCIKCSMYNTATKTWTPLPSLQKNRWAHASTFIRERIFLFGGASSNNKISSVISLNPDDGKDWQQEPELPFAEYHLEVVCAEVNGSSRPFLLRTATKELISLDMETNSWGSKTSTPVQCRCASMIAFQDTLLVAGGKDRCFARYSPDTDTWVTGTAAPSLGHSYGALVSRGQSVYLIGGDGEDRVEEYNLATNAWAVCELRLPKKLGYVHALALDM